MEEKVYSIKTINNYIKYKFDIDNNLKNILITGEILEIRKKNVYYISLKDDNYTLTAKMYIYKFERLHQSPREGDKVILRGTIEVYPDKNIISFMADELYLDGDGAIKLELQKLKLEFTKKGYFLESRKRMIPQYPKNIAVITSKEGKVIDDIRNNLRCPKDVNLLLYPSLVQGPLSARMMASQIIKANNDNLADVIIIGRGGGSKDDLFPYNDRFLCEMVFHSKIPIISAIGHDEDAPLADLIADKRVSTPTAAAALLSENYIKLLNDVDTLISRLNLTITSIINKYKSNLVSIKRLVSNLDPLKKISTKRDKLDVLTKSLNDNIKYKLSKNNQLVDLKYEKVLRFNPTYNIRNLNNIIDNNISKLNFLVKNKLDKNINSYNLLIKSLNLNNPASLLNKGYTTTKCNDKYISSVNNLNNNDVITVHFKDGNVKAIIKEINHD